MSNAMAVTDDSFQSEVLQAGQPVVVDFWAEWCGPCKLVAPVLDELAGEYDGKVKIAKLNVDENPAMAGEYGVRSIPTLLFFKGGKIVDQVIGAASKADLKKRLDAVVTG
jgi:thioredoxin 1